MRKLVLALFLGLAVGGTAPTAGAQPGGTFMLQAHDGRVVRDDTYHGQFLLIYFGYTFCPDVCPTALVNIAAAMDALGDEAERVQPLFVTVDPERDTPEVLADYVAAFHPGIVGLSGPPEFVRSMMGKYGVRAEKVDLEDSGTYLVDHTSSVFVMGPDGAYVERMPHTMPGDDIAARMRELLAAAP